MLRRGQADALAPDRTPVAAYVRMSTDLQKYSITNQLVAIEAWCRTTSAVLVRIYTDAGRSGLTVAQRPGLQSLISDARAGALPFEAVIVLDVSRFGRFQNVDEAAYYEQVLKRAGAPVIYCAEAFQGEEGVAATILKTVKRAMAAEFSRELSVRVRSGHRAKAERGEWCSSVAGYAYRRVLVLADGSEVAAPKGVIRLPGASIALRLGPPAEVRAVRRMFALCLERRDARAIAAVLNAEGRPAPGPEGWKSTTITRILMNPKYAGAMTWGRTRVKNLGQRASPAGRDNWVVVPGTYPAIISPRTFAEAQRRRVRRPRSREEMIAGLKALDAREGMVTRPLIEADPYLPSEGSIERMFGSLKAAYLAAGLPLRTRSEAQQLARRLGKSVSRKAGS